MSSHSVEDRGYETPCWIATKKPDRNGYVNFRWWTGDGRRTRIGAHRIAYMRINGPIPEGLVIDHLCGVRNCVNPEHLEAVSHTINVRRTSQVKLSPDDVRAIRASSEGNQQLAKRYGVSHQLVSAVRLRKIWMDVD